MTSTHRAFSVPVKHRSISGIYTMEMSEEIYQLVRDAILKTAPPDTTIEFEVEELVEVEDVVTYGHDGMVTGIVRFNTWGVAES